MQKYLLNVDEGGTAHHIDYRNELNAEQYKVVTEAEGPCLVLAGPGSGKTRTLIYRIAYILEQRVPAKNILLMTFTNKAAHQMQQRLEMLLKAKPAGLWCGTFHHVANRSLRICAKDLGLSPEFGILDDEDQRSLIKMCSKGLKDRCNDPKLFPSPAVILSIISYSRNSQQSIDKTVNDRYSYLLNSLKAIQEVDRLYQAKKRQSNNLDYDDLLLEWLKLLKTVPSALMRFSEQFRYVLVDEYQDTNRLQFAIVQLLASHHKNLLVVGDDAQSIYSFRAADIKNILEFPKRFENAKIYKLQTNYRSVAPILGLANSVIKKNTEQFEKEIVAARQEGASEKPRLIAVNDMRTQSSFIVQRVMELHDQGVPLHDIAVLYRAHYQSAELEMELVKKEIPYIIRGGVRFFEQAHIKDVLAYLKIIQNPQDEISWIRALSLHAGIGAGYADKAFAHFIKEGGRVQMVAEGSFTSVLPKRAAQGFEGFRRVIKALLEGEAAAGPDLLIQRVMESGYRDHLMANFDNARDRVDDIIELANFAHTYKQLKDFLADVTLREGFKGETLERAPEDDNDHLILSTIHQAKGLEWSRVFMIGLSDGQFPHPKSIEDPAQFEEERRLFYVAVTRAKDEVYLLHSMTRFDYNYGTVIARPSAFLEELSEQDFERWEIEQQGPSYDRD